MGKCVAEVGAGDTAHSTFPLNIMAIGASGVPCPPGMSAPAAQLPTPPVGFGVYSAVLPVEPVKNARPSGSSTAPPVSRPYGS